MLQITLTSVMVYDQDKALEFYTEVLGFVKKQDLPAGEGRWLTVVSPAGPRSSCCSSRCTFRPPGPIRRPSLRPGSADGLCGG